MFVPIRSASHFVDFSPRKQYQWHSQLDLVIEYGSTCDWHPNSPLLEKQNLMAKLVRNLQVYTCQITSVMTDRSDGPYESVVKHSEIVEEPSRTQSDRFVILLSFARTIHIYQG